MSGIIDLNARRAPVVYTVTIAHHYDGTLEFNIENVADDERSREADEIDRLREENEQLREENDAWRMDGGSCAGEVKRLRAENARLRVERDKAAEEMWKASDQAQAFRKIIERMPAQSAIVKLAEQQAEIDHLREENARLREALKPFAEKAADVAPDDGSIGGCLCAPALLRSYFFNAAAAIREGGKDG